MFLHCFKYSCKDLLRTPTNVFWIVLFPCILGTLFYIAFSGIYDNNTRFNRIPIAVCTEDCDTTLRMVLDNMTNEENPMFSVTYCDREQAKQLCTSRDVKGVIYKETDESTYSLMIYKEGGIEVSIIRSFLKRYNNNIAIITEIAKTAPLTLPSVMKELLEEDASAALVMKNYSNGNMNPFITYMYNLLGMACFFVSMASLNIAIQNQANLSPIGARVSIAPTKATTKVLASLTASFLIFYFGITLASVYLYYILKVDFGIPFAQILLLNLFGVLFGNTFGFFVGSIGRMKEAQKLALLLVFSLGTGFLSGLMVGNIPIWIEENCPIINRINPMRVFTDCFYTLSTYGYGERLYRNIIILCIWIFVLILSIIRMLRRKQFSSI